MTNIIFIPNILNVICNEFHKICFVNSMNLIMTLGKPRIHRLVDLKDTLRSKDITISYADILSKIQFGFKEVEHLCFWDRENYSKISIDKGEDYELLLICWEEGQSSQVHNHDLDEAWTYILKGQLTEEIYTNKELDLENKTILNQKDVSSIKKESGKVHRLSNSSDGRSVSLHLYKR